MIELILAISVPYIIAGLFISRWWWRHTSAPFDPGSQAMAFWILLLWPLFILGLPIYMGVRAFYGQPHSERTVHGGQRNS